jgi:hypothetical protein
LISSFPGSVGVTGFCASVATGSAGASFAGGGDGFGAAGFGIGFGSAGGVSVSSGTKSSGLVGSAGAKVGASGGGSSGGGTVSCTGDCIATGVGSSRMACGDFGSSLFGFDGFSGSGFAGAPWRKIRGIVTDSGDDFGGVFAAATDMDRQAAAPRTAIPHQCPRIDLPQ